MGAGSLDLGELYAKLAIDYSDLHKAELSAINFANNTNKELARINKTADNLKSVGKNMSTYVTAPIVGAGFASVKFANDFDKAVREVNSLLDPKDQNFSALKDQIRGVSLELGTDLVQSAKAAYSALGAGVPKDNLIEFLTVSSKAAIGGVTSVETAVDGFTSVMNAWGKSAGNVTQVADVMFQAVKYGKVTFEQFASSIAIVSGMASQFNIDFKEVAAYSALATAQGEKQTVAMTQMRQAISELIKPNKELAKVIQDAGIKSIKTTLQQKGLAGTWNLLSKSAEKNHTDLAKSIGSIEALQYVLKVTGKNAESATKFLDLMGDSAGANEAAFKELDKARGFDKLINDLKALATIIGDQLMPIVIPMVETFTSWIVEASKLDPGLTRIGIALAAVAAAIGPVLVAAGSLLGWIAPLISGAGGLSAVLASLTAVAGPVGIAFAAIVAAGYLLYNNWDKITSSISNFTETHKQEISSLQGSWGELGGTLASSGSSIMASLEQIDQAFFTMSDDTKKSIADGGIFATSWNEFFQGIIAGADLLGQGLNWLFVEISRELKNVQDGLTVLPDALNIIGEDIASFVSDTYSEIKKLPNWFKEVFDAIVVMFNYRIEQFKTLGSDLMIGLKNGITNAAGGAVDAVKTAGTSIIDGAKEAFDSHSPSKVFVSIGKDLMDGLGIGIANNTNSAVAAMIAAGDTLNATAKQKLTQQSFGSFESNIMLDTSMGTNGTNYELELQKEQAYYDQSKKMLEQAQALKLSSITSYASIREAIEEKHTRALIDIQRQSLQSTVQSLDATLTSLESFGQKQSGIYKAIFAVSKAFAIADALLALQQNIANASKIGFPYNIPFIAGAVAQGTAIVANVSSIAGAFNNGGYIPTGQIGMVGEKGPEFVSGPANVFSTQNTKEALSGSGRTNVKVNVMNYGNSKVEVTESGSDKEKEINIVIDRVKQSIAADAIRGDGTVDKTFASVFKLSRTG